MRLFERATPARQSASPLAVYPYILHKIFLACGALGPCARARAQRKRKSVFLVSKDPLYIFRHLEPAPTNQPPIGVVEPGKSTFLCTRRYLFVYEQINVDHSVSARIILYRTVGWILCRYCKYMTIRSDTGPSARHSIRVHHHFRRSRLACLSSSSSSSELHSRCRHDLSALGRTLRFLLLCKRAFMW